MKKDFVKILAVLAIVAAGFTCVVWHGHGEIRALVQATRADDLLSGQFAAKFDRVVFEAIPRSVAFDGAIAGLAYRIFGDVGGQVRAGCDGWLYSTEELRVERQDAARIAARLKLLPLFSRLLARRGILLVVVPVPDKAEQLEEHLCGVNATQSRLRDRLWDEGSRAVSNSQIDLRSGWPRPGYWRNDTHWDQEGASFAANRIAQFVNEKLGLGSDRVMLTVGAMHRRNGDLTRLAGLENAPSWLAPIADREVSVRADVVRSGGLLDDVAPPSVILAGSSFSLNSGFADYLQTALSRDIAQLSQSGGGFAGALLDILEREPDVLASAKVVIWEWPMRSLVAPLTDPERRMLQHEGDP